MQKRAVVREAGLEQRGGVLRGERVAVGLSRARAVVRAVVGIVRRHHILVLHAPFGLVEDLAVQRADRVVPPGPAPVPGGQADPGLQNLGAENGF